MDTGTDINYETDGTMIDQDAHGSRVTMSIGGVISGVAAMIIFAIAMSGVSWIVYTIILGLKAQM